MRTTFACLLHISPTRTCAHIYKETNTNKTNISSILDVRRLYLVPYNKPQTGELSFSYRAATLNSSHIFCSVARHSNPQHARACASAFARVRDIIIRTTLQQSRKAHRSRCAQCHRSSSTGPTKHLRKASVRTVRHN